MVIEAFLICALALPNVSSPWDISKETKVTDTAMLARLEEHWPKHEFMFIHRDAIFTKSEWERSWKRTGFIWLDKFAVYARLKENA